MRPRKGLSEDEDSKKRSLMEELGLGKVVLDIV
jgi:hypothetical protein